jgi:DNA polymerase III sliding clamp (beta) subunit (PCNA family)
MPKFSVHGHELAHAVENAILFTKEGKEVPATEFIGFHVHSNECTITASNLVSTFRSRISLVKRIDEEITFMLPAKEIVAATIGIGERNAVFNVSETSASVKVGSNVYRMQLLENGIPFSMENKEFVGSIVVNGKSLAKAISTASMFSCPDSDSRDHLKGQIFIIEEEKLKIVSTNSVVLVAIDVLGIESKMNGNEEILVPSSELAHMSKIMTPQSVEVLFTENSVRFISDYAEVDILLLEAKPVKWRSVVPDTKDCHIAFDEDEIKKSIKRASAFSEKNGSIVFEIKKNGQGNEIVSQVNMISSCEDHEREAKDVVPVTGVCHGEERSARLSYKMFSEVIKVGYEMFDFYINEDPGKPIRFEVNSNWNSNSDFAEKLEIMGIIATMIKH